MTHRVQHVVNIIRDLELTPLMAGSLLADHHQEKPVDPEVVDQELNELATHYSLTIEVVRHDYESMMAVYQQIKAD